MVRNEEKYRKAKEFRQRGFTYSEIAKIVGVSKGTVSHWFGKQAFSKSVRRDNELQARRDNKKRISLFNKARLKEKLNRQREADRTALTEFKHYKQLPHFIGGLMLYIGAGDVGNNRLIRLADARPAVHRIFINFARDFLGVEKTAIRFWAAVPGDAKEDKIRREWAKNLGLSPSQFYKSQIKTLPASGTLRKTIGNTIIGNAILKRKLQRWIELASEELGR